MKNNINIINKQNAVAMAAGSLVVTALLICKMLDIFEFSGSLAFVLPILGYFTTLTPLILWHFKVSDRFLKYYMSIILSIFIGSLGCYNGIGIYITFVIVPVASCLYFDKMYTFFCALFSYFVMVISVYINCAGKMEVKFYGWSQRETFIAYIIGFTLEYFTVSVFLYQIMRRADRLMNEQKQAFLAEKANDAKYQLLVSGTKDIIFEYSLNDGKYYANRSIYQKPDEPNRPVSFDNFREIIAKYQGMKELHNSIKAGLTEDRIEDCEIDMSYSDNGVNVPLWFNAECFIVRDGNTPVSVIGKMHDITRMKLAQADSRSRSLESLNINPKRRNSIYEQAMAESAYFSEEEYKRLANGHRFLAKLLEDIKYMQNLSEGVMKILSEVGEYFNMDRICVVETDASSGTNTINYQWNSKEENRLVNYFMHMGRDELKRTEEIYNKKGYIEINPSKNVPVEHPGNEELENEAVYNVILGNQIWIPMLANDRYIGAISFDRYDTTLYTTVDKFLLSETVNTLTTLILKINAENQNRAKSDFLSTMSHEIRTPMNAIVGLTEVSLREDMPDQVKKNLRTVKSSAFGLLTLINDILDYSKIEAGKFDIVPEKFSILSVLNDVKEMALARNNGKLDVQFLVPSDLPSKFLGDSVRIKQVMVNYCTNAIKYSDKGIVEVNTNIEKVDEGKALLHFSVKDNGIGIKEEDLGKLFKSYARVDTTVNHHKEGTGLGLAICKQLIELMNGSVNVESKYGQGSTFSFVIPLEVVDWSPAGRLEDFRQDDDNDDISKKVINAPEAKILIVDDTAVNLMVAKALLKQTLVQTDTADSGEEALKKIEATDYDLVFMDHFMPGMDGVETTERIRVLSDGKYKDLPIVALTADAMSGVKEELMSKGMNDFLTKPIIIEDLYRVLETWLPKDKLM